MPVAVESEDGPENSELEPAHDKLSKVRALDVRIEETTDVAGPPGDSADHHSQAGAELTLKCLPGRLDVAGPDGCPIALATRPRRADQDHPVVETIGGEPVSNGLSKVQRK